MCHVYMCKGKDPGSILIPAIPYSMPDNDVVASPGGGATSLNIEWIGQWSTRTTQASKSPPK